MKKILFYLVIITGFIEVPQSLLAQVTQIYSQSFAGGSLPTGFSVSSGAITVNSSSSSSGYTESPGGAASGGNNLQISGATSIATMTVNPGISTVNYTNVTLQWGARYSPAYLNTYGIVMNPTLQWSADGTHWYTLNYVSSSLSSSTWGLLSAVLPPSACGQSNIQFLWTFDTTAGFSGNYKVDDINVSGTAVTNYYSKASGALNSVGTWTNSAGGNPTDFISNYQVFNVTNSNNTFSGSWSVSGSASKIVVYGSTFSVTPTYVVSGTIDVKGANSLVLQNSTLPTIGNLDTGSTVIFNSLPTFAGNLPLPAAMTTSTVTATQQVPYGNITFSNTSVTAPSSNQNLVFAGNFVLQGTSTFNGSGSGSGYSLVTAGNASQTINGNGSANFNIWNLDAGYYYPKNSGTITCSAGNTIYVTNSMHMILSSPAVFSDGGCTFYVGNNVDLGGSSSGYTFTGTINLNGTASSGAQNIRGWGSSAYGCNASLNNLVIATFASGSTESVNINPSSGNGSFTLKGSLTVNNLNSPASNGLLLQGNTLSVGGNFYYNLANDYISASGSTIVFNGSSAQTYSTAVASTGNTWNNVTISNSHGLTINSPVTINNVLNFTSGNIVTGSNTVFIGSSGSVTGTGTTSYINGTLSRVMPSAGVTSMVYPVGDNSYSPVKLSFSSSVTSGSISVSSYSATPTGSEGSSLYFTATDVKKHWNINNVSVAGVSITPTFSYSVSDVAGGGSNSSFVLARYSGSVWNYYIGGTTNSISGVSPLQPYTTSSSSGLSTSNINGDYVAGIPVCTASPTAGTATASPVKICGTGTSTISVTNTTGYAYQWGTSSTRSSFTAVSGATAASYTTPTIANTTYYTCTVTCLPSGGTAVASTATVTVAPIPTATLTGTATICSGHAATLTATGTPSATVTTNPSGSFSIAGTGVGTHAYSPVSNTTYTITTVSLNGCTSVGTGSAVVTVNTPVAAISGTTTVCYGSAASLSVTGTNNAVVNINPLGIYTLSGSGTGTYTALPTSTTTYTIASVTSAGCSLAGSGSALVNVNDIPVSNVYTITTIAGNGTVGYLGDGGAATTAELDSPGSSYVDGNGIIYVVDSKNNVIRKIDASGNITTVAGNGTAGFSGDGLAATSAQLNNPSEITFDASGNMYIADFSNYRVRIVNTSGIISTFTGDGSPVASGDGGAATAAGICPISVYCDVSGNIIIADPVNNMIRKVNPSGVISTIAGNGIGGFSGDGGYAATAELHEPVNVCEDIYGNIYIADDYNAVIREITTAGIITTVAGNTNAGYNGDGIPARSAKLNGPAGIRVDSIGNLYIVDAYNYRVRKVNTEGIISTIAGTGVAGFSGDGGLATAAQFNDHAGVNIDNIGNVYISDYGNSRVRKMTYISAAGSISGSNALCTGGTITLVDTAAGGAWSVSNTNASISGGTVTGLTSGSDTTYYTIGNSCGNLSASYGFTVSPQPTGTVTADINPLCLGSTATLSLSPAGGSGAFISYTWNGPSAYSNTITAVTTYTDAVTPIASGSNVYTVTISYANPGCIGNNTYTVNVNPVPTATITGNVTICAGSVASLSLTGTDNAAVALSPAGSLTLTALGTGIFSASPASTTVYSISSVSLAGCNGTGTGNATVTITPLPVYSLSYTGGGLSGPVCSGNNIQINSGSSVSGSYNWSGPSGYTSTTFPGTTIANAPVNASGDYSLALTDGTTGCISVSQIFIAIDSTPVLTVSSSNPNICTSGTSTLVTTISSSSYNVYAIGYQPVPVSSLSGINYLNTTSAFTGTGSPYDDGYIDVSLPFTFNFNSSNYNDVYIGTNGYITFGSGATTHLPFALPSASAPANMVALFYTDLVITGSTNGAGTIAYGTIGTSPNEAFVINYNAVQDMSGNPHTGEIILYQNNYTIEVHVDTSAASVAVCGVQQGTAAGFTPPGRNDVNYAIATPEAWRFATPVYNYVWIPATDLSATTGASPVASLSVTTTYSVTTIDENSGCTTGTTGNTTINVTTLPTINTISSSEPAICNGNSFVLTLGVSGGTGTPVYTWSGPGMVTTTGLSTTSPALSPTTAASSVGIFSASVSYPGSGCSPGMDTISIALSPQPSVTITPAPGTFANMCTGASVLSLTATISGGVGTPTYSWQGPVAEDASFFTSTNASAVYSPSIGQGSAGTYTFSVTFGSGSGCNLAPLQTGTVTFNDPITITAVGNPTVCLSSASLPLSYACTPLAFGTPNEYGIVWTGAASAYFAGVASGTALPASPISLSVTATPPAAIYTGTITFINAGSTCSSPAEVFSVNIAGYASASISPVPGSCYGYSTAVIFNGSPGATVAYSVTGGSVLNALLNGSGQYTVSIPPSVSANVVTLISAVNSSSTCMTTVDSMVTVTPGYFTWVGNTTAWNVATNWNCGYVPAATDTVIIPLTANVPTIGSGVIASVDSLIIPFYSPTPVQINIQNGGNLNLYGNLSSYGNIKGAGSFNFVGSSPQFISGYANVANIKINNSHGVFMNSLSDSLFVNGMMTLTAGTFNTLGNGNLVIVTDSFGTSGQIGTIPPGGGSISGNVTMKQWIKYGYRAYRFWGHPFSTNIPLSQIENFIDITGNGGSVNGFTSTGSNAASAFWYDNHCANAGLSTDPGWIAFLTCNPNPTLTPTDTNYFKRWEGIRLFDRGYKGEGLDGLVYTPGTSVICQYGPVNMGNQSIPIKNYGTGKAYNQISNPYPSPTDIGTVIYNASLTGGILGALFYVWNPYLGTAGAYQNISIGTSPSTAPFSIQPNTSFQVRAATSASVTPVLLNFTEANKSFSVTTVGGLLRTIPEFTMLTIYDNNYHPYDSWFFAFNQAASDSEDIHLDGGKAVNPDLNFYSWSASNTKLAADARPYEPGKIIPLGFYSDIIQPFIIKVDDYVLPDDEKVFLHDKLLNSYTELHEGTEYKFNITKDPKTQGDNRFELTTIASEDLDNSNTGNANFIVSPNPATNEVNIVFANKTEEKTSLTIFDVTGVVVYQQEIGNILNGQLSVDLSKYASGIYLVQLSSGNSKSVVRLVKE